MNEIRCLAKICKEEEPTVLWHCSKLFSVLHLFSETEYKKDNYDCLIFSKLVPFCFPNFLIERVLKENLEYSDVLNNKKIKHIFDFKTIEFE